MIFTDQDTLDNRHIVELNVKQNVIVHLIEPVFTEDVEIPVKEHVTNSPTLVKIILNFYA